MARITRIVPSFKEQLERKMPTCQRCHRHGWFLRLSPNGLCTTCQIANDLGKSNQEIRVTQERNERQIRNKVDTLKRAQMLGIFLTLEFKNDRIRSAVPIAVEEGSAIFIEDDSPHRKLSWKFHEFEILDEGYHLETEETVQKNLADIRNRKSNLIESLEYWNDKIESVFDENLIFVSEELNHINVRDADSKPLIVRKPFIRSIFFEGQVEEELLSKLNAPLAQYEGYKFFDLASKIVSGRSLQEIISEGKHETVIKLLNKALEDQTVSPNIHAKAFRTLGEISEIKDEKEEAISFYEKAISLNPNIGVKKRLAQLKATMRKM